MQSCRTSPSTCKISSKASIDGKHTIKFLARNTIQDPFLRRASSYQLSWILSAKEEEIISWRISQSLRCIRPSKLLNAQKILKIYRLNIRGKLRPRNTSQPLEIWKRWLSTKILFKKRQSSATYKIRTLIQLKLYLCRPRAIRSRRDVIRLWSTFKPLITLSRKHKACRRLSIVTRSRKMGSHWCTRKAGNKRDFLSRKWYINATSDSSRSSSRSKTMKRNWKSVLWSTVSQAQSTTWLLQFEHP